MTMRHLWVRAAAACHRRTARWLGRRPFTMPDGRAIVSFTFDDFPRSALAVGGAILADFRVGGTYYVSLGLAGRPASPCGELFTLSDLRRVVEGGHELGCHTFDHCPAWATSPATFVESVRRNADELQRRLPDATLRTLSYPISYPRPETKRQLSDRFCCCRGGGQTFNRGIIDLNYLSAFFLEQSADDFAAVKRVIFANQRRGGWLIFATHDVAERPTRFGCTSHFFEKVVRCVADCGAMVLPVGCAWDSLHARAAIRPST